LVVFRGLEASAGLAAPQVGERLGAELEQFLAGQTPADDVTLVVVKVL
jgi:serine phosphatase RsbU (regulator of sigma subunit)